MGKFLFVILNFKVIYDFGYGIVLILMNFNSYMIIYKYDVFV